VGAAKLAGAQEIVAVDLADAPLAAAVKMGANSTVNGRTEPDLLASLYSTDKGYFDVGFECTGVGIALGNMFPVVKPRGTIVAVGVSSGAHIPFNALVGKEIRLAGTHRFHAEYPLAARMIAERRIDVRPIITATLPMESIREAFNVVRDRSSQMKVQLSFTT
jgi:L-idonate 5-dehydrogenase